MHAGGLRYHGDSPLVCALVKHGLVEARAHLAAGARRVVLSAPKADTRAQRALHPSPWFMEAVTALGRKFTAYTCDFSDREAVKAFAANAVTASAATSDTKSRLGSLSSPSSDSHTT